MPSALKERRLCNLAMRGWLLSMLLLALGACQTAGGNSTSATLESARAEAMNAAPERQGVASLQPTPGGVVAERAGKPVIRDSSDPVLTAVVRIGRLQKAQGTLAAMDAVFQCYERAQEPRATIADAKVCAAQDFAVSKSVEEGRAQPAGRQADARSAIISRRAAQRIGALMQLKGMNQAEFDRFGLYLHQVVKPAHIRAMS